MILLGQILFIINDRLHFLTATYLNVITRAFDFQGNRRPADDFLYNGRHDFDVATVTDDRVYFAEFGENDVIAYNFQRTTETDDNFTIHPPFAGVLTNGLGARWIGAVSYFEPATPTISSTHDFIEDQSGNIIISFDNDVTGFQLSDITISGGVANSLTENNPARYTLNVTPSTGSTQLIISIAENVVSPGNNAATRTFNFSVISKMYFIQTAPRSSSLNFVSEATAVAYDFDRNRLPLHDINLGTTFWGRATVVGNILYVIDLTNNLLLAWHLNDGSRQSTLDIDLVDDRVWAGIAVTDDRIIISVTNHDTAYAIDFEGNAQPSDNINIGIAPWRGAFTLNNRIHFIQGQFPGLITTSYDFQGMRTSADDFTVSGTHNFAVAAVTDDRVYFTDFHSTNAEAYNFQGTTETSDDFALMEPYTISGAGWLGAVSYFEPATPTISSTHDFIEDQSGNIIISFDTDVTGFQLSDITISGGVANSLTENNPS